MRPRTVDAEAGEEYTRAAILAGCFPIAPVQSVAVRMVVGGDAEVAYDEQLAGLLEAVVAALPRDRAGLEERWAATR